jgi:hypothetical protein
VCNMAYNSSLTVKYSASGEAGMDSEHNERVRQHIYNLRSAVEFLPIPTSIKAVLLSDIDALLILCCSDDIDHDHADITPAKVTGLGGLPDIHLHEFSLYPRTRELVVDRVRHRLPPFAFRVIYELASNANNPVSFNITHSFHSRLSNVRRDIPILRTMIENVSPGYYQLNSKGRK